VLPGELVLKGPELVQVIVLEVIKKTRRRPPPLEPVRKFSISVSGCLVYYDLLPDTEDVHPLAALAISGYLLYAAISGAEPIEDDEELEKAWSDG
jgi:hypothetical protein